MFDIFRLKIREFFRNNLIFAQVMILALSDFSQVARFGLSIIFGDGRENDGEPLELGTAVRTPIYP